MIRLNDFFHLPQLDPLIAQMVADGPGLVVVAGVEAHGIESNLAVNNESMFEAPAPVASKDAFLPSGLSTFFDILIQTILAADVRSQAIFVAREKTLARVPRQLRRRIKLCLVEGDQTYERQVKYAIVSRPALLVIDRLTEDSATAALDAARQGLKVITCIDTPQRGAGVARQMLDLKAPREKIAALRWVISMQRLPMLDDKCRQKAQIKPAHLAQLKRRYPHLYDLCAAEYFKPLGGPDSLPELRDEFTFYRPGACATCHQSGRYGEVTVFDVFRSGLDVSEDLIDFEGFCAGSSVLPMEEYILRLVVDGRLSLDDLLWFETDQLSRAYQLLVSNEKALTGATSTLNRKLFELEATNRVLLQRTEVLISLEDLGQALIASVGLGELASRVCRRAAEVCGADRVILYFLQSAEGKTDRVEVLAVRGWDGADIQRHVDLGQAFGSDDERKVVRYVQIPPGVKPRPVYAPNEGPNTPLRSGLRVPLMAQNRQVGAMIVQSTSKSFFTPGETALLQTFANQAALAIQREGLVDELKEKIDQLQAAQVELVQKERMERELELARQVQQSLLPDRFPELTGFDIAARNIPARQVGGDFYDAFALDDDHFGIVVADVSDKGMPAALYMALSRSLILAEAHRQLSPAGVLRSVNRLLLELGELNGFVSVFYGVIERSSLKMRYTRAGHERPWLLRDGKSHKLSGDGVVLGAIESDQLRLSEEEIDLRQGDRLVMYSDGLTDVLNPKGVFFGADRLAGLLGALSGQSADQICRRVFDDLQRYIASAEQFDDMTLLVLEVKES